MRRARDPQALFCFFAWHSQDSSTVDDAQEALDGAGLVKTLLPLGDLPAAGTLTRLFAQLNPQQSAGRSCGRVEGGQGDGTDGSGKSTQRCAIRERGLRPLPDLMWCAIDSLGQSRLLKSRDRAAETHRNCQEVALRHSGLQLPPFASGQGLSAHRRALGFRDQEASQHGAPEILGGRHGRKKTVTRVSAADSLAHLKLSVEWSKQFIGHLPTANLWSQNNDEPRLPQGALQSLVTR